MRATASRLQSDINVTPLVDVCLVLLIIFMVVTPLMVTGMNVDLPQGKTAETVAKGPLQITVKSDKTVYIGSNVIHREALATELRRHSTARPVLVSADKSLAYGEVVDVLDACRDAGFESVGLAARSSRSTFAADATPR